MSEMSAIMTERDRQDDQRLKQMSQTMERRDSDVNTCMAELTTTMQDLTTLGVRAVVAQTAAAPVRPSPVPVAKNSAIVLSTSAAPPLMQKPYRKIAQSSGEQTKPPKLIPPAKRKSTKQARWQE